MVGLGCGAHSYTPGFHYSSHVPMAKACRLAPGGVSRRGFQKPVPSTQRHPGRTTTPHERRGHSRPPHGCTTPYNRGRAHVSTTAWGLSPLASVSSEVDAGGNAPLRFSPAV